MARHGTMDGYRRLPVTALSLLILAARTAQSHPQYLDDFPSGHNSYFTDTPRIGSGGAVGSGSAGRHEWGSREAGAVPPGLRAFAP